MLSADLFGDWREEVVWRNVDSTALLIFSTNLPTPHRLTSLMQEASAGFGENGRHLIRYSGTENKIRVLVEHRDIEECRAWVSKFAAAIREEIG